MTKENQIEEMAEVLKGMDRLDEAKFGFYESYARAIYNAGYRKAADVAREIFEEIEEGVKAAVSALQFENNPIHRKVKHETYSSLMRFIKTVEQKMDGERREK